MRQRLGLFGLFLAILIVGCRQEKPTPRAALLDEGPGKKVVLDDKPPPKPDVGIPGPIDPPPPPPPDEVAPDLPRPTAQQLYEQSLLEAVDHLAERRYKDALAALEKAKSHYDTDSVTREIDKVRAILDAEAAAERAILDVKAILDDGKAQEAAKLAGDALSQYGGGDMADELAKLKQEAEAVVTAAIEDTVVRRASLKTQADEALNDNNLRGAVVSLEQAVALGDDLKLTKDLSVVRSRLDTYDDNRTRALELRRDPSRVELALERLQDARKAWDTLQVRQEIDQCQLILERRRDRISVADFEVLDDVGRPGAGRIVSSELLPLFRPRFDLVERAQVSRILSELRLDVGELGDSADGRRALGQMARLRYLVVGSLSSLGGVTLQARLVEVPTGLVVQTARVSAPNMEALVPKLRQAAVMLQMNDEQKLAYEVKLQKTVVAVRAYEPTPLVDLPPPPPPPAPTRVAPVAIITYTAQPIPFGALVVEDVRRPPPVVVAPQPLALVLQREDPRRHRLFRLSLELGDNCYRRGLYHDAHRHFSLAFSIGGPRREVALRLDNCRTFAPPPPPPPPLVLVTPVVPVVQRPVVIARPRVAVFGFVPNRPMLVPPAETELLADQFASYCRGSYEIIDRGEVCWYMGRLNLTLSDVLRDPVSRRCLAQALHARYFVYGSIFETASFDVETQLVDAETGARSGTGKIHVQNTQELRLRMGELARQVGAKPADQQAIAKKGAASEKALTESRGLMAKQPAKAAEVARAALKDNPDSTALQALLVEADRRARVARVEEERRATSAAQAKAQADARLRQQQLAKAADEARKKAVADAAARDAAATKQQQMQREKAALALRARAKEAQAKGQYALALQQLQSASKLQPHEAVFQELAQAKIAADKANTAKAVAEKRKHDDDLKQKQDAAVKRVQEERTAREMADLDRRKLEEDRQQALYDNFLKQAKAAMAKKDYAKALAAAQSARRTRPTEESQRLIDDAHHEIDLARAKGAEKAKLAEERKKREDADKKRQANQAMYLAAIRKAEDALAARRFDEAATEFQGALKLYPTDVTAKNGLKSANDLREDEKKRLADEEKRKQDAAKRTAQLKVNIDEGKQAMGRKDYAKAAEAYKKAVDLAPSNVDALAGYKAAEAARTGEVRRRNVVARNIGNGKASFAKKDYAEAVKAYKAALALEPNNAEAKKLLGEAEKLVPVKPVVPIVDPKIKERETAYSAAMQHGAEAMKAKKFADAEKFYNEALKHKPGDAAAIKAKREAIELTKVPVPAKIDPKMAAYQKAMGEAKALVGQKKYGEAIKAYDQALQQMPKDPAATKERGDAVRQVTEAAYSAWMQKGAQAQKEKKLGEAEKAYDEALRLKPGDAAANKGKKEATTPPPKPAAKMTKTPPPAPAKSAKDKQKEADYKLAMDAGRAATKNKNHNGAVNSYDEALRLMPGDATATAERAAAVKARDTAYADSVKKAQDAMKAKKYADAIKAYEEALKQKPGDAAATKGKKDATDASQKKP